MRPATWIAQRQRPADRTSARQLAVRFMNTRFLPHIGLVLLLAVLVWVGTLQISTPDVVPATAPATAFSAERAMDHLRAFAIEPRPIGSPGNLVTRQYLIDQLHALGLEPEVQTTSVVARSEGTGGFGAGTVNNIIVRVPGSDSSGAIAINAHYDGGATGPAASDAGSGVVTALETLRAVVSGEALRNDLIVVFADGEENGMLGAAAFMEQHPWAQDVRFAINYEAQGSGGPAILYATGDESGWLVKEFLRVVPDAGAYSMLPEISRLVPDARLDCDLGEYTEEGVPGLGFVYASDTPAYHTALDNVERIDAGSIQQEGGYTLALVHHFGDMDLSDLPRETDHVYFNVLPGVVVHYAFTWVVPLALLITALVGTLVVAGVRRGDLTVKGLVAGTFASLGMTLATVTIAVLIWFVIRTLNTDYQVLLIGSYQTTLYIVALTFASVASVAAFYALLRRKVRPHNLAAGVLIGGTLALWFTSITVPGISYIVAWPLLFGSIPLAWRLLAGERGRNAWARVAILTAAAVPAIILLPGTLYQIVALVNRFEGLTGMPLLGVTMIFVAPLIALFLPHIEMLEEAIGGRRWVIPALAAAIAIGLIGWGNLTSDFDAQQPRPNQIAYELNADSGQARWISFDRNLDGWTEQFFPAGTRHSDPELTLYEGVTAFVAPAPAAALPAPEVSLLGDTINGGERTLVLNLSARGDAAHLQIVNVTAQGPILAAAINEQRLDVESDAGAPDGELTIAYANVSDDGWNLTLTVRSTEPVTIEVEDVTDGLPDVPGMDVEPRPADMMPAPGLLDPTIVSRAFTY